MNKDQVILNRLANQGLIDIISKPADYKELFKRLQPVSPQSHSYPGSPPTLFPRTKFNDEMITEKFRRKREIVKGRFMGGSIGYVLAEDLDVYANAFQQPLESLTEHQHIVLETLDKTGPLTPRQFKAETGLLNKHLMPMLHRLQKAFLVYEDQVETDWERSWYSFESEWPDLSVSPEKQAACLKKVIIQFIQSIFFANRQQIKDWSKVPSRILNGVLDELTRSREVSACSIPGLGEGWISNEKAGPGKLTKKKSVFSLHRADPLVRAFYTELNKLFKGLEVLQYLLIDGEFKGAVCGHWRIGPFDVDDIVLLLPKKERLERKNKIVKVVTDIYGKPLKYDSRAL
jgi:hypothetical protein